MVAQPAQTPPCDFFFIHTLYLLGRLNNEEIVFSNLLPPHNSGVYFLPFSFFFLPAYEDLLNVSRFLRRVLFLMMQKNFNIALANGKVLVNY